jgi:hypothetical protein
MKQFLNTYTTYSVGCAVVWALILIFVASEASSAKTHQVFLVFFGWVIGWLSATIARVVYPPARSSGSETGRS